MKRNEQREQAFILLFEYLFLPQDDLVAIYDENIGTVSDYAKELYTGVLANLDKLDETLASYSKKWKLYRLPKVSLTVLRLALYEMEFVDDLPDSVAINEAVELARSTAVRKTPALSTACWVLCLGVRQNDSRNRHQQLHHLCRCAGR